MKSCKPGYVYWVCSKGDYAHVKNGYTTKANPTEYCEEQYAKTMVPLEVIAVVPVANSTLMEKVSHHALHPVRVHGRHEVFDLSLPDGSLDRARLDSAIKVVTTLTELSGLPLPEDPDVIAQRKALEKIRQAEARKVQTAKRKAEREAEKQAEKRCAKQRKVEEAEAASQEVRKQRADEKQKYLIAMAAKVHNYIDARCAKKFDAKIPVTVLKEAVEDYLKEKLAAQDLKTVMIRLGYVYKRSHGNTLFVGL